MRRTGLVVLAFLAATAGGALAARGERYEVRTGEMTLERAVSRAFKRDFAAARRMRTGRADSAIVRHADVRCTPLGEPPGEDSEPWPWRCRVRWYLRARPEPGLATYGVRVDERGCFEARSGAFPDRLFERVLDRDGPDPLVYVRSCP